MKVCPLTRISSPAPENQIQCSPLWGCLLHGKSIQHFESQHPSRILGVYDRSGV